MRYKPVHAWFSVSQKLTFAFYSTVFPVSFVAKRYILQQKCLTLKGHELALEVRNKLIQLLAYTSTLRATMYSVTDRQTDGQTDDI